MAQRQSYLVQLLLPLLDNSGRSFPDSMMREVRDELVSLFGGLTAFSRTPAEGVWSDQGHKIRDEVILVEVMVEELDKVWWAGFRARLESTMQQQLIVIRSFAINQL